MRRFDPATHQPHPPGYFLYICLGRAVDAVFHDSNAALVAVSILFSCAGVLAVWLLARTWFGTRAADAAGLIFALSPLVWFHGIVALTYISEACFSALTGYLCWRVYCGAGKFALPLALAAGIAAGFRPSFLLFLAPLILFSLRRVGGRYIALFCLAFSAVLLAWLIPMVALSGGTEAYLSALVSLWRTVPGKQTMGSPIAVSVARILSIAGIFLLCFGCAAPLVFRWGRVDQGAGPSKKIFTWVWIAPGLLFFGLVFLKFVNSGYLLVISPPVFAWLGHVWTSAGPARRLPRTACVGAFVVVNTAIFLFAPVYCSYGSVRRFEAELPSAVEAIRRTTSPADTVIVGFDSHFLGYRHAGYYLPQWITVQFPEVRLASGIRAFSMEHGDTTLRATLPLPGITRFVFFPLPSDDREYRDYTAGIRARFPADALTTIKSGGVELTTGDVKYLPLLFPTLRPPQKTAAGQE
jgi:hypothetical protein